MKKNLVALIIITFYASSSYGSTFTLSEDIIGVPGLKTECVTSSSKSDDYCKTQIAHSFTLYTGAKFGQLSLAQWGGTDQHSASKGKCGLLFDEKDIPGNKDYIEKSVYNFTACYFKDKNAISVLQGMMNETRFDYYAPKFRGKNKNQSYYTSDIALGWLSNESITPEIVIGAYIHHLSISAKRTTYDNAYYGHAKIAKISPLKFGKILSTYKYQNW